MQLVGFNFKKILVERNNLARFNKAGNVSLGIKNVEKENISLLKDEEALKFEFNYSINHKVDEALSDKNSSKKNEEFNGILFEGNLVMAATKEEADLIMKAWEKNEIEKSVYESLCNIILRKCVSKAVLLTDELGLPLPVLVPKMSLEAKQQQST